VIAGVLLILLGIALVAVLLRALRSERIRQGASRGNASLRSLARMDPGDPETIGRQFEAGIYFGLCLGVLMVILGLLTALT
jgi:hypothetical protein